MPTLVARIPRALSLMLALSVPLVFLACGADDPVAPTAPSWAKGGNGKGGGPDGGDGGSGGSTPAIAGALVPGIEPNTDILSMLDVAGDYLTGYIRNASEDCGFVYRISAQSYECMEIPDAVDGSGWIYGVRADGLFAASYQAVDGSNRMAVLQLGAEESLVGAVPTTVGAPEPYTDIRPSDTRPINAAGQILVDVRRAIPYAPGPWRLGVVSADLQTITMTSGDEYDWVSGSGLSDDGYGAAVARELGAPERDYTFGTWTLAGSDRLDPLPGTDGRRGATVSGVFEGSGAGLYGHDSNDRPVVWADPGSAPTVVADTELLPAGHDDSGRIFGRASSKGNEQPRMYCLDPATGLTTELAPPEGYESVWRVRGSGGSVVFGNTGNGSGTGAIAMWDLSEVEGGCY